MYSFSKVHNGWQNEVIAPTRYALQNEVIAPKRYALQNIFHWTVHSAPHKYRPSSPQNIA